MKQPLCMLLKAVESEWDIRIIYLQFKIKKNIFAWRGYCTFQPLFYYSTYINKTLKISFILKKLVQNIPKNFLQIPNRLTNIYLILDSLVHFYFLLDSIKEKNIKIVKIFDFRFLTDLHVSGCPEHDFTIFRKCLSVYRSVCLSVLFCGRCNLRTNGRKLMKLNIQLHLYGT